MFALQISYSIVPVPYTVSTGGPVHLARSVRCEFSFNVVVHSRERSSHLTAYILISRIHGRLITTLLHDSVAKGVALLTGLRCYAISAVCQVAQH